jgi:hypothetical protein
VTLLPVPLIVFGKTPQEEFDGRIIELDGDCKSKKKSLKSKSNPELAPSDSNSASTAGNGMLLMCDHGSAASRGCYLPFLFGLLMCCGPCDAQRR